MAIAHYGWRGALVGTAVAVAVVTIPLIWFVVVNRPEDLGLLPDGVDGGPAPAMLFSGSAMPMTDWTFGALLKDLNFWVITLSMGVCFASATSVIVNLHPYATDLGIGSGPAALLLSCISICGIGGKLLLGAVADYFQARYAMWLAMAGLALFLGVLLSHPSYGVLLAGCMVAGLALGGLQPVWGALIGRCFGRQAFGRVMGLMSPAMGPLLWAVFPFTGWVRDRTGSYDAAFVVFLAALLLGAGLLTVLRLPHREPGT
jgi:cyanate permease